MKTVIPRPVTEVLTLTDYAGLGVTLGQRFEDKAGKVYVFCKGVASCAAGDWVKFDEAFALTRLVADAVGPVGIAMGAIDATTKGGWVQVYGVNAIAKTDTVAADKQLYIDGTTGRADDLAVTGDIILGAMSQTADTSNVATVFLNYPMVTDTLG